MRKISVFILFLCTVLLGHSQDKHSTEVQLQRMKNDYQEWLSKRSPTDLLVEYDTSPIALDIPNPRFSWIINLEGRDRRQTAYQLLVSSNREILEAGKGDMWNTDLLESDQSAQLTYDGLPLESNREYYWKVCLRDESGKYLCNCSPAYGAGGCHYRKQKISIRCDQDSAKG